MFKLRSGPVALVVSAIALFMSMGGTGYALNQTASAPKASQAASAAAAKPAKHDWHSLTLTGGWKYAGFDSDHAAYYIDASGVVHLRGSLWQGSTTSAAFRLPVGARPSHVLWLLVYANHGSSGELQINPTGRAFISSPYSLLGSTQQVTLWTSLDGISFPVP
jgi:hypothetical protein